MTEDGSGGVWVRAGGHALLLPPSSCGRDDVVSLLTAEGVPLEGWLEVARASLERGGQEAYMRVLQAAGGSASGLTADPFSRIKLLCSLAAFNILQSQRAADRRAKANHLAAAQDLIYKARQVDPAEQLAALAWGQLELARGDTEAARKQFEAARKLKCNGRTNAAPLLALAALHFSHQNYTEALDMYRRALSACPAGPPELRLGLAACYFKLGDVDGAMAAYQRVLELQPDCTQAMLGLAVLKLSVGPSAQALREGSQLLAQTYQQDPGSPYVLGLLAHFCLRQGFNDKATSLARMALGCADTDDIRAEALVTLARAHHALGQHSEAYRLYQQASQLDPELALPRYGLAQMDVLQGNIVNAVSTLEGVLAQSPSWLDAVKLLGSLYPRLPTKVSKAAGNLKAAAASNPELPDLWELLGDTLAATEPAASLSAYRKAIDLHRQQEAAAGRVASIADAPARLLNNAAVLHMRVGEVAEARELLREALQSAAHGGMQQLGTTAQVTLGYNMARVREAGGELAAAEQEYQALLAQFPTYVDCLLRLSAIAKARGDTKATIEWAEKAAEVSGQSHDALMALAHFHFERRDYAATKQVLDRLQELLGDSRFDSFAKLLEANVHFATAPCDLKNKDMQVKAESHLGRALSLYKRVLEKDPGNIFAANGIGCVLAEANELDAAKDIFKQVKEAAAATSGFWEVPEASVNLASVYLAQGDIGSAIQTYTNAIKKFYNNRNPQIMFYLARAQYDADQVPLAKRTLCKALHLAPTDRKLRFNLAYMVQETANRTCNRYKLNQSRGTAGVSAPAVITRAVNDTITAFRMFMHLKQLGHKATGVPSVVMQEHLSFLTKLDQNARKLLEHANQAAKAAEAQEQEQVLRMQAAQKLKEVEEQKKRLTDEVLTRQRQLVAQEHAQRLVRMKQEWKESAALKKAAEQGDVTNLPAKGAPSVHQRDAVDALFEVDDEEADNDYVPGQDDSDAEPVADEGQAAAALAAAGLESSEDEEDDEEEPDLGLEEQGTAVPPNSQPAEGPAADNTAPVRTTKQGGRLQKRAREAGPGSAAASLEDSASEEEPQKQPAKKRQYVAVLDDDLEEDI